MMKDTSRPIISNPTYTSSLLSILGVNSPIAFEVDTSGQPSRRAEEYKVRYGAGG